MKHSFEGGKYTVEFLEHSGDLVAQRYDDKNWRSLSGDGMVLAMLHEVDRLRYLVARAKATLEGAELIMSGLESDLPGQGIDEVLDSMRRLQDDIDLAQRQATDPTL